MSPSPRGVALVEAERSEERAEGDGAVAYTLLRGRLGGELQPEGPETELLCEQRNSLQLDQVQQDACRTFRLACAILAVIAVCNGGFWLHLQLYAASDVVPGFLMIFLGDVLLPVLQLAIIATRWACPLGTLPRKALTFFREARWPERLTLVLVIGSHAVGAAAYDAGFAPDVAATISAAGWSSGAVARVYGHISNVALEPLLMAVGVFATVSMSSHLRTLRASIEACVHDGDAASVCATYGHLTQRLGAETRAAAPYLVLHSALTTYSLLVAVWQASLAGGQLMGGWPLSVVVWSVAEYMPGLLTVALLLLYRGAELTECCARVPDGVLLRVPDTATSSELTAAFAAHAVMTTQPAGFSCWGILITFKQFQTAAVIWFYLTVFAVRSIGPSLG